MPIQVTCPSCTRSFHAPDAAAGRRAKCPKCSCPIDVPVPIAAEVLEAEPDPARPFADDEFDVEPPTALPVQDDLKPCPMCGEMIQRSAVKCRHCGEVFDPTMKGLLGAGSRDVRDPGWGRVRSGLATMYYSILIMVVTVILMIIGGGIAGGLGAVQGRGNQSAGMIIVIGLGVLVIIGAGLGMLVGQAMCANVPASSGARGFAIGAICCLIGNFVLNGVTRATGNPALGGLGSLVSIAGYVLFILFIRRSAAYLNNQQLASSAGKFLIFGIILFVLSFGVGVLSAVAGAQTLMIIVGLIAVIAGLVGFVWYMRLIKGLMDTIDARMGARSVIRDAGSAALAR